MNRLHTLSLGCLAVFVVACTNQHNTEMASAPAGLGAPVEREGVIYTPVSVGSQGCLLYHIKIPGGQAPAALAYQSTDGRVQLWTSGSMCQAGGRVHDSPMTTTTDRLSHPGPPRIAPGPALLIYARSTPIKQTLNRLSFVAK